MRCAPRTLLGRLVLVQIVHGALIVLAFAWIAEYTHTRFHYKATQTQARDWASHVLSRHPELRTMETEWADGSNTVAVLAEIERDIPGATFYLLDEKGDIVAASVNPKLIRETALDMASVRTWFEGTQAFPLWLADPLQPDQQRVFSAAVVKTEPTLYLLMILQGPDVGGLLVAHTDFLLSDSMKLATAVMVPALATATGLFFMILQPIGRIRRTLAGLARTGLEAEVVDNEPVRQAQYSELDQVSRDVDAMARRIADLLQRLKDDDRNLRDLYAALSHDLRTPLMIIKNGLDRLGPVCSPGPPAEMEVTLRSLSAQVRSLERMLDEQFELANLQRSDYCIQAERFPIAELVQDVVDKFAARAAEHGVTVRFERNKQADVLLVEADVMLIERVLDNLIDNAIRHAVDATEVRLEVCSAGDRAEVYVLDNGRGLPSNVVHRLEGGSRVGIHDLDIGRPSGGLGLRVVHRIVELHRGMLLIEHCRPYGTRIGFRLQCVAPLRFSSTPATEKTNPDSLRHI